VQTTAKQDIYSDTYKRHEICTIVVMFPKEGQLAYRAGVKQTQ
jgi:hypothetical protein